MLYLFEQMVEHKLKRVLVLEDDAHFDLDFGRDSHIAPFFNFNERAMALLRKADEIQPNWDLLYAFIILSHSVHWQLLNIT